MDSSRENGKQGKRLLSVGYGLSVSKYLHSPFLMKMLTAWIEIEAAS